MGSGDDMKELIEKLAAKIDDLKTSIDKLAPLARVTEQLATLPSKVVALQSSAFENQEQGFLQEMSQKDEKITSIVSMGFPEDEAKMAITREEEEVKNAKVEHDRKEQLCNISQVLAVLASASSVTKEHQEFLKLVNKEIELYNTMLEKEGTEDEEARRAYMAAREESDHAAELLDSDRDGKVTPEEVATAANYLKDTTGKDGVQELISNLSKDKEGKILVEVLVDSIYASETAGNAYSANLSDYEDESISFGRKKTKFMEGSQKKRKRYGSGSQGNPVPLDGSHEEPMPLPNPMIGFSLPSDMVRPVHRTLPDQAFGPPFFYYEILALAPKGVWTTISRFLYNIQPEFEDSSSSVLLLEKRDEIISQYSPMSEDSDDYRCYDPQINPSASQNDAMVSPSTSPMSSPHRFQKPQSGFLPANPYPLPSCSLSSVVCSHARRGSESEGRFPSSPNDMCHGADLRRTALLSYGRPEHDIVGYIDDCAPHGGLGDLKYKQEEKDHCEHTSMDKNSIAMSFDSVCSTSKKFELMHHSEL
ncbi:hypothetical protein GUJ93_ZPchr0010g9237 [Zizania palustris]|uniref:EF-hand domain-containing protein n=1 Tax=Zizania palustris TaxID=103762 RepID=A0A8J6BHI2_ZIZPA|nr:hypothetical protein GUJ93_ZPchr0010g9237 [Zizania palustris]